MQKFRQIAVMRFADKEKSVDAAFNEFTDLTVLLLGIVFGSAYQQCAPGLGESSLQSLNGTCKVAMLERWKYSADRAGTSCRKSPRSAMRHPSQMPHHRSDSRSELFRNGVRAVHGSGNG